jgi:hypothetical protein
VAESGGGDPRQNSQPISFVWFLRRKTNRIMKRLMILALTLLLLATACASEQSGPEVTVFRAPT